MYGIFTYIWVIFRVNVGKYSSTMEHLGLFKIGKYGFPKMGVPLVIIHVESTQIKPSILGNPQIKVKHNSAF